MSTMKTAEARFIAKTSVNGFNECWPWNATIGSEGRMGQFWLNGKVINAHRASFIIFNGEIPPRMNVCHTCDNSLCVNPRHLFIGTQRENLADMTRKGRRVNPVGEHCGSSRLLEREVVSILKRINAGHSVFSIAHDFGVNKQTVYDIKNNKRWRHVILSARDRKDLSL